MLQLMQDKKLKSKFRTEFGATVEDFMDQSEAINFNKEGGSKTEDEVKVVENVASQEETQFYLSEEEFNDERMLQRLEEANKEIDSAVMKPEDEMRMQVQ